MYSPRKEQDQYTVVIGVFDGCHVLIADGEKRKFILLRKNINHLTFYDCVSPEVQNSIFKTGRVIDGQLRTSHLDIYQRASY
ncbi:hypothetical protein HF326_17005 [Bacillus altitudinis MN12]|nr:hypothetical protein BS467_03605 [Bacillus altitudinis]MBR0580609.1 hypothetical protein [Bacillus altitudinis A23-8]MBR0584752.1 hypothetical protein [Bacillus altitudinis MN12]MBR0595773.1 hypothetical protein [Bacillus altitudinis C16B11]MBR0633437.1 hypothetical protein [Bacillus altitudinis C101]